MAITYAGMWSGSIAKSSGQPALNQAVSVYPRGSGTLATLLATPTTTPYPLAGASTAPNPTSTDGDGNMEIWAQPGYYSFFINGVLIKDVNVPVDVADIQAGGGSDSEPILGSFAGETASYTILQTDNGKQLSFPGTVGLTATLPATVPTEPWMVAIINKPGGTAPLAINWNGNFGNGSTSSIQLWPYENILIWSWNGAGGGNNNYYYVKGFNNPIASLGDLIYGGSSGLPTALSLGAVNSVLKASSTVPTWTAPPAILDQSASLVEQTGVGLGVTTNITAEPSITLPVAGRYLIIVSCQILTSATAGTYSWQVNLVKNAATALPVRKANWASTVVSEVFTQTFDWVYEAAANDVLTLSVLNGAHSPGTISVFHNAPSAQNIFEATSLDY